MRLLVPALALTTVSAAHAQPAVTIYGRVEGAPTYVKVTDGRTALDGGGTTRPGFSMKRLDSNVLISSRLGFRVTEDLGNGLQAKAVLEHGFTADTGVVTQGGVFWGRQSYIGLSGTNWSLTAGRQYTPIDLSLTAADAMGGYGWGHVVSQAGGLLYLQFGSALGTLARADNSILYDHTFGPIRGSLMVSSGNEVSGSSAGRLINPALFYTAGPLLLTASVAKVKTASDITAAGQSPQWETMWTAGGRYDFGSVKLFAGLSKVKRAADATYTPAAKTPFDDVKAYWLGASTAFGNGILTGEVAQTLYDNRAAPRGKSLQLGVKYEYLLSKRTTLFASAGLRNFDSNSRGTLIATVTTASADNGYGADYRALSVGMSHAF